MISVAATGASSSHGAAVAERALGANVGATENDRQPYEFSL